MSHHDDETPREAHRIDRLDQVDLILSTLPDKLSSFRMRSRPPPVILPPVHDASARASWRAMTTRKKISTVVLGVVLGISAAAHLLIQLLAGKH